MYVIGQRSPSFLGGYRPNQAIQRVYTERRKLAGLGQLTVDPTLLFAGIGTLALAFFLLGGKTVPKIRSRRRRRLQRKLAALGPA